MILRFLQIRWIWQWHVIVKCTFVVGMFFSKILILIKCEDVILAVIYGCVSWGADGAKRISSKYE